MEETPLNERELISRIRGMISGDAPGLVKGIGDDCAVLEIRPGLNLLATIDCLVEGVHFSLDYATPYQLGWKSIAVNLSDIASMGGEPRFALISLSLPPGKGNEFVSRFYEGVREVSGIFGVFVVGGNVSLSPAGVVMDVALLGEVERGKELYRSGARVGDLIYVTGTLGDSSAGMRALKEGEDPEPLASAHLTPMPRVKEGRLLAGSGMVTAMIDVSDGLAGDLAHVCAESGVGAEIFVQRIPMSAHLKGQAQSWGAEPLDFALYGGEDYELLFTVKRDQERALLDLWREEALPITKIGGIVEKAKGIAMVDRSGSLRPLPKGGYDHFRRSP